MPELNFKGKEFVYNHHLTVPFRPLLPQADKGIGAPTLDGNLIIHGDNLHGLKALLPTHAGKVDCIFIDPPYNTGNEGWCYNDNVNSPMIKEWLASNPIGVEDALRHDKWACMMWPRLRLLRELLAENGTIFISIDDNEILGLLSLMDEIFGRSNRLGNSIWKKKTNGNNVGHIPAVHDYIVAYSNYAEGTELLGAVLTDDYIAKNYSNPDSDPNGDWTTMDLSANHEGPYFPIKNEFTGDIYFPSEGRYWVFNESEVKSRISSGRIVFGKSGKTAPVQKIYLKDKILRKKADSLWANQGLNSDGMNQLGEIFGKKKIFDHPKPSSLVEYILEIATDRDAIVLDSFAGSGTTAHAVLAANAGDGGNRKFILVEGEDYADSLTAERVRRVINGYDFTGTQRDELLREPLTFSKLKQANSLLEKVQRIETLDGPKYDKIAKTVRDGALIVTGERAVKERTEGLGGSFTYCELGAPIDMDGLLTGADLPDAAAMAALLYHTATAQAFDPASLLAVPAIGEGVMQLGVANGRTLWLIYKPDLDWLKSSEAALTLSRARAIAAHSAGEHLVFAPAKFVSRELLAAEKLPVEFAPLPFALYRVETA